ncbi:MAG: hypothetical protein JO021_04965 [Alphaproteobacteria bacterium]|nr:hypothetical protein [Alphaproteobacteria bacterium]
MGGATMALAQSQPQSTTANQPMRHHAAQRDVYRAGDRDTQALNLLEAKGYTGIQQFHPVGKDFEAMLTKDGKQMAVTIDPDAGTIQNRA